MILFFRSSLIRLITKFLKLIESYRVYMSFAVSILQSLLSSSYSNRNFIKTDIINLKFTDTVTTVCFSEFDITVKSSLTA